MSHPIPLFPYRIWFVYLEPLISVYAAYHISFTSSQYLAEVAQLAKAEAPTLSTPIQVILWEFSGILLLTAYQGFFILGNCNDQDTWTAFVKGHLFGDFIHLTAMLPMGINNFWRVWGWDEAMLGNFGFVYTAILVRLSFLLGLGFKRGETKASGKQKAR